MPSLKDLRNRITSVKSTQKITKAMKMVAAAKLRKAQENAEKSRLYSEKMNEIITNLKSSITDQSYLICLVKPVLTDSLKSVYLFTKKASIGTCFELLNALKF